MITYRIISKNTSHKPANSPDNHKKLILERASKKAIQNFPIGCTVQFVGSKRLADVLEIYTDLEKVHWKKLKPFFIRIKFHDNDQVVLTHGTAIRRKTK